MDDLPGRLAIWAHGHLGAEARVDGIRRMPGSAGLSFGFDVRASTSEMRFVLRLTPPGVASRRNSNVLGQAELLRSIESEVPVPKVIWSGAVDSEFGTPGYIVSWMPGRSTDLFTPGIAENESGVGLEPVFDDAMRVLARIHSIDWRDRLADWSTPRSLIEQLEQWTPTLLKSPNGEWIRRASHVRDLLLDRLPDRVVTTLVHGDYYSNNWMFERGRMTAVIDWEIAEVGAGALDLGWVCMMYDHQSWAESRHRWSGWHPNVDRLISVYRDAGGPCGEDVAWFRAFAGYRLACITAFNVYLHESGKRVDPVWAVIGDSFDTLLARAEQLVVG